MDLYANLLLKKKSAHNLLLFNLIRTLFIIMIIIVFFLHASKTESEKTKRVWCVRACVYLLHDTYESVAYFNRTTEIVLFFCLKFSKIEKN